MEYRLLFDIIIIFILSVAVLFVFLKMKMPAILGLLMTGVLAGPYGLSLIGSLQEVELLAELGVVLLLFTIGIEFSLKSLLKIKKQVFLGGFVQVAGTVAAAFGAAFYYGLSVEQALFAGLLFSLSSTAIVLRLLQERAEIESPHGRMTLAILIFQDIIVVLFILMVPLISGKSVNMGRSLAMILLKAAGVIALMIAGARWIIPPILYQVTKTRSRELFLLVILVICLSVAWGTHSLGLSPALGAFLAGLVISESEYGHHAFGSIISFRDIFMSLFFVSIGMLLNPAVLLKYPLIIAALVAGTLLVKLLMSGAAAFLLGYSLRTALLTGLALCQVGEFAFILAKQGINAGIVSSEAYQIFLAVSVITMSVTPFIIILAPGIADAVLKIPLPGLIVHGLAPPAAEIETGRKGHLVIVGFGLNGKNLAKTARAAGIDYVIIEMNPDTVRKQSAAGEPIFFGDASYPAVLHHADVDNAKVMVIAIADPLATRLAVAAARSLAPSLYIIVRTRFFEDINELKSEGADEVIPEEFETSIEIFSRVLNRYLVPRSEIDQLVGEVRSDGYGVLRHLEKDSHDWESLTAELSFPEIEISSLRICRNSGMAGKSLADLNVRQRYGITVMAVKREGDIYGNPESDFLMMEDDIMYVLGKREKVISLSQLCLLPATDKGVNGN